MRPDQTDGAACTRSALISASANSRVIGALAVGKKTTSRAFSASDQRRLGAVASTFVSNGESVVATFFLMRYQSVVASRREINFARQLFRICFFIFISALQQDFADALAETFRSK